MVPGDPKDIRQHMAWLADNYSPAYASNQYRALHAHQDRRTLMPVLRTGHDVDSEGTSARACPRHGVAALDRIASAQVDWADSEGLNEWERKALELAEERSQLG